MSRAVRIDALPEFTTYRDTGCSLFPARLSCPLPLCRFDLGIAHQRANERVRVAAGMAIDGHDPHAIAQALGITVRTVYRSLTVARAQGLLSTRGGMRTAA